MLVGLSGGADSTALLVLARALAHGERGAGEAPDANGLPGRAQVHALYVHHHLRVEADGEVDHCAKLCTRLGVPFTVADVHPTRARSGLAADARRLRHAALTSHAKAIGANWILLAHHADDQLETLLMRIGRGAGNRGLAAIPWVRRASAKSSIRIARPLLSIERSQIETFCRECDLAWCEDASNLSIKSARGLLRMRVVPALRERWPAIAEHALLASEAARSGAWALGRIAVMEGWTKPIIPRTLLRLHGPQRAAALLASALEQRSISLSLRVIRLVAQSACDRTVRPRVFQDAGYVLTLTAKDLTIAAIQ